MILYIFFIFTSWTAEEAPLKKARIFPKLSIPFWHVMLRGTWSNGEFVFHINEREAWMAKRDDLKFARPIEIDDERQQFETPEGAWKFVTIKDGRLHWLIKMDGGKVIRKDLWEREKDEEILHLMQALNEL